MFALLSLVAVFFSVCPVNAGAPPAKYCVGEFENRYWLGGALGQVKFRLHCEGETVRVESDNLGCYSQKCKASLRQKVENRLEASHGLRPLAQAGFGSANYYVYGAKANADAAFFSRTVNRLRGGIFEELATMFRGRRANYDSRPIASFSDRSNVDSLARELGLAPAGTVRLTGSDREGVSHQLRELMIFFPESGNR